MRAASYLKNFLERNSFYAQTKMRKHVVCCAMTHKHWGKIATFNLVFVMIRWMNVNIHLLSLAHPIKALVKQKYISLFFHNFLQKLFEVPSEPKTDQVCTFLFSTWKLTLNASVRKHHLKQFACTFTWFIGVMRHNCFQCPWNFCLQHLITSDTCSEGLPGVKLSVFATFRWSGFWNYFGIITCSCWSLRRNAKTNLGCLVMTFSGMSLFDVFFPFKWLVSANSPMLEMSTSFMHTMHRAWCLVLVTLDFSEPLFIHRFLKPQLAENALAHRSKSFTREITRKRGRTWNTWLFAERVNSTKHFIGPYHSDIQPIGAINITKNVCVHWVFDQCSERCYDRFYLFFWCW